MANMADDLRKLTEQSSQVKAAKDELDKLIVNKFGSSLQGLLKEPADNIKQSLERAARSGQHQLQIIDDTSLPISLRPCGNYHCKFVITDDWISKLNLLAELPNATSGAYAEHGQDGVFVKFDGRLQGFACHYDLALSNHTLECKLNFLLKDLGKSFADNGLDFQMRSGQHVNSKVITIKW